MAVSTRGFMLPPSPFQAEKERLEFREYRARSKPGAGVEHTPTGAPRTPFKLTEQERAEVAASHLTSKELAEIYGVSRTTIRRYRRRARRAS